MDTDQQLTKKERRELRRQEKIEEQTAKQQKRAYRRFAQWSIVILVAGGIIFGMIQLAKIPTDNSIPVSVSTVADDDWVKGNSDSNVIIVEYLDFECEACGAYYPLVKRLTEEYGDRVLFVSRYFPLAGHRNSMTSALAVESAGKQGRYWEMHDLVFEKQRDWGERKSADKTIFEKYAKQLNLNMEQFKRDRDSKEVKSRVIRDRNFGNRLGINGTPTFFLNGKKIQNPRGYEAFKSLIDNALKQ